MDRKQFLSTAILLPVAMGLSSLGKWYDDAIEEKDGEPMPVLFVGHGSPMNGIEINEFSQSWIDIAASMPRPKMVLCISAHWLTRGSYVTAMKQPPTIHDFGGFPQELYEVEYPAPGSLYYAEEVKKTITSTALGLDHDWGLDHGCWTIVRHMYPDASIPVLQLSIDYSKEAAYHYQLAGQLASLRKKGVLIIGSGNIVHNLSKISFGKDNNPHFGFDWALQANEEIKGYIVDNNHEALIDYKTKGRHWDLAIPSPDHYFPLMYSLGLKNKADKIEIFNDKAELGSLTMTSVRVG